MKWVPEKHQINKNTKLVAFKTDKFKTAVLKLSMVAPMKADAKDTALFSLMINLLRSGTEKYPEKEDLIKRLNDLYDASCSIGGYASGDNRILEISSEMLDDRFSPLESILEGVVSVMSEMLLHPRTDKDGFFRAEAVEREKKVICDKIKSEKNNTRDYALRKCREIMCAGEPYRTTISSELIKALTREEMTAFYRSFLASSNISFSYVGALDGNVVAKRIKRIFKDLPNGKNSEIAPLMLYPAKDFKLIEEEMNVKQGVLVIGMRTGTLLGEYDAPVMTVFNNVYGGTYMSRLFKTVREKMSLCYYCSSDFISTKAVMYVSCGIDVANFERAKDEILAQLEMLKREHVTDEELAVAKDLAVKELREMTDYPSAIATFSYSRDIYGIKDTIESLSEKIEKVSSDDILRVANKIEPSAVFFLKGIKNDEAEEEDFYGE
jgi:predicted Zn-dependent peptidase